MLGLDQSKSNENVELAIVEGKFPPISYDTHYYLIIIINNIIILSTIITKALRRE